MSMTKDELEKSIRQLFNEYDSSVYTIKFEYEDSYDIPIYALAFDSVQFEVVYILSVTFLKENNFIKVTYNNDENRFTSDDYYEVLKFCKDYLKNYYDIVLKDGLHFLNVANINNNDWVIYLEKYFIQNPEQIGLFIEEMYNHYNYKDMKDLFNDKFGYLINANKFDLI